ARTRQSTIPKHRPRPCSQGHHGRTAFGVARHVRPDAQPSGTCQGRGLEWPRRTTWRLPPRGRRASWVGLLGGGNSREKAAFPAAAARWVKAIVGDLPPVRIGDDVIDDILIEA